MISVRNYDIANNIKLSVINIPLIDEKTKSIIDESLVSICEGASGGNITNVKKDLSNLFSTKNDKWKMGAIAEFFMHLHINAEQYKQEFIFRNIEENSIKKGFDGLYTKNGCKWLMESKSGSITTKGISHKAKVAEAMSDLEKKVAGKEKKINPWRNAYHHASLIQVNASKSLIKDLQDLSDEYINEQYHSITEFNTIPCGTIFLKGSWQSFNSDKIFEEIKEYAVHLLGKNIYVICMTQNTIDMFIDYLHS